MRVVQPPLVVNLAVHVLRTDVSVGHVAVVVSDRSGEEVHISPVPTVLHFDGLCLLHSREAEGPGDGSFPLGRVGVYVAAVFATWRGRFLVLPSTFSLLSIFDKNMVLFYIW